MQHNKVGEPKLFSQFGLFSLLLVAGASFSTLSADTYESFSRFKKSQAESYQTYRDERDGEFSSYLKQQFKAYNVHRGTPLYEKPKPKQVTPAIPTKIKPVGPKVTVKLIDIKKDIKDVEPKTVVKKPVVTKPIVIIKPDIEIKKPIEIEKPVEVEKKKDINFDFYGSKLGFYIPKGLKQANFYPQNQKGIASFFNTAASSEYEPLVSDIKRISKSMNLNDWGVYLLVLKVSNNVFNDHDNSKLLSWFLFNKLGYAVKVGLANKHVVLMHYSKKVIYSTPNYKFSDKKYYVVSNYAKGSVGRLFSYKQDYPGATKSLDLSLNTLPNFTSDVKSKTLKFEQFGNKYSVKYKYNKNLIDFMQTYPQADYETYFNTPLDSMTYKTIASDLKKYIDGKKASEAMNLVLSFVQKSFEYETDPEQFGREKPMFAQETLYFDKSDCEDRAVLFAYLIKELFHIPVVGVKYKDHMSTALYIPIEGDRVTAKSKSFVIADPTYINANIGMNMPKYKSIKPEKYIYINKSL